ncbi:helix-turn-helix domain-containing protein [Sphingomonas jatrophae]|uniref:Helix-turn-helix domain-containing protein n=1 Tax=Sphingomonas jatrophae TaxID=1166337 RepID=A0A1I6LBX9_9SPHN|nr:helix-turn-helix transcriptional regulator [Sphingomonas jatrophae]SFS00939.1 Helix-turn-helix domain-containing protein [Sphingomonas jatrophae]
MITRIREVRRAKGMTLAEVGAACEPPTTAQTIGRLETGTRTVSVGWLNRIAHALGVAAGDLVELPEQADLPVAALLGRDGAQAPRRAQVATPPQVLPGMVAVTVDAGVGDYRAGDVLWCERLGGDALAQALNRDLLVPLAAGRFAFGRLLEIGGDGELKLLPPAAGAKPQAIPAPAWGAVARTLVRAV